MATSFDKAAFNNTLDSNLSNSNATRRPCMDVLLLLLGQQACNCLTSQGISTVEALLDSHKEKLAAAVAKQIVRSERPETKF